MLLQWPNMVFLLCLSSCIPDVNAACQANHGIYPPMPKTVVESKQVIPKGWHLVTWADGDLDKDGVADRAMVIDRTKAAEEVIDFTMDGKPDGSPVYTYPRMLIILKGKATCGYGLWVADPFLLDRKNDRDATSEDQETRLQLSAGRLHIAYLPIHGHWDVTFLLTPKNAFKLARFEGLDGDASSIEKVSIDFAKGVKTVEQSSDGQKSHAKTITTKFHAAHDYYLGEYCLNTVVMTSIPD